MLALATDALAVNVSLCQLDLRGNATVVDQDVFLACEQSCILAPHLKMRYTAASQLIQSSGTPTWNEASAADVAAEFKREALVWTLAEMDCAIS